MKRIEDLDINYVLEPIDQKNVRAGGACSCNFSISDMMLVAETLTVDGEDAFLHVWEWDYTWYY